MSEPPVSHRLSAWDGLMLHALDWPGPPGSKLPALLCLPGLVRTAGDFSDIAARHAASRRVVALDYPGRGASGRARDVARYAPEACLRDVLDMCAALHLHRVVAIGISFGGLLAMALTAARPSLLAAVVLDDIGPDIGTEGADFVRDFVADDPALPGLEEAVAHLRARLPHLSLATDAEWRHFTELTYAPGPDARWHPVWDTRIADLLARATPPLWPLFGALAGVKLLLVHGGRSNILLPETVARMRGARPDMTVVTLPGIGHAPTLSEPAAAAPVDAFVAAA